MGRRLRGEARRIASERIRTLFQLALKTYREDLELANRYVALARAIGMQNRVRVPREYRGLVCRRCKRLIVPGFNARVRLQRGRANHLVVTCLECGGRMRRILGREG